ncbi:hypothetical protein [Aquimarina agarilytica]|uniref:hypothetical protein n=1 Tax=Aquimarina agarilytica TaxID=1087449 RepID=UPI0002887084|nr:hypothetical protein [Aquimarina agarilytica]
MTELFNKLGIGKVDEILILNEPEGFCQELDKLHGIIIRESVIRTSEIDFALIFVTQVSQIQNRIETVYPKLVGDAVIWFAYPSDASKTEITETTGWGVLGDYNLKKIETTPINEDWNGVHFRKIEFIGNEAS